ncbi:MAG: phosphoadenosine phosphosulfate reductase domain-containing protein [Chloroflexota bacterium]
MKKVRHILSLSGGKDSTALAIYMRDRVPEMEYVFCDTEKELPETYAYLEKLEAYLGKPIKRLMHDGRGFDHYMAMRHNFLPSPLNRWCTQYLKLRPFEKFVGDDPVISYVGIRADEDREGYISHKRNITTVYPFKEDGIVERDVLDILRSSGLDLPEYYRWRSRSGCYFCFFQQKIEWVGLLEVHPDLFEEARYYEELSRSTKHRYTWTQGETLAELAKPERVLAIKEEHARRQRAEKAARPKQLLMDIFDGLLPETAGERACLICDL